MKSNRMGLLMIAATLAVIGLIVAAASLYRSHQHERQMRAQGVSLSRSLSSLPLDQLVPSEGRRSVLHTAVGAQRSDGFAYALLVSPTGQTLVDVTTPGTTAPSAPAPAEPASWFGERTLRLPDTGQRVLEFHGPVMRDGQLAGFVRLGYLADAPRPGWEQLSFAALLALPIFLLTPVFYGLMRRELAPLTHLGDKLRRFEQTTILAPTKTKPTNPAQLQLNELVDRFGRFLEATEKRVRELETQRVDSVASNRLIAYRKDKIEVVLQSIPEGILVLDEVCMPTFANACLESLIGVMPEKMIGQAPVQWCKHPALLAFMMRHRSRAGEALPRAAKADIVIEGPQQRHLGLSSFPLFSPHDRGSVFGTLIVIRDTTQEQIARHAGADFVSHVSHELKTPLASVVAYSELLMGEDGADPDLRVEAVNVIHDEAERMASLINNLLNISKIDSGAMPIKRQRVNLHDLLVDAFESQRQSAVGNGLIFRINVPHNLGAAALDKDLFRIAINNVLSNAIKYNSAGSFVELSAEENEDQTLSIFIRDGGIGIPPEQRARIFEKYYRVPDVGGATPADGVERKGHGLGLYLVKQIIELHQGSISVDSHPGRGTEFCIRVRKLAAVYEEALAV